MIPVPGKVCYSSPELPAENGPLWEAYDKILAGIGRGRYRSAMATLAESLPTDDERLAELNETYRLLMSYYARGAEDPERPTILANIGSRLVVLANLCQSERVAWRDPSNLRNTVRETLRIRGLGGEGASMEVVRELVRQTAHDEVYYNLLEDLFDLIWTCDDLTEEEERVLSELLEDPTSPQVGRVVASALLVGCALAFDPRKVRLLFVGSRQSDSPMVQGASVPALLLLARLYQDLIETTMPDFVEQARQAVMSDPSLHEAILLATLELHNCYRTEEDHKVFRSQLLPKLNDMMGVLGESSGADLAEQMEALQRKMMEDPENSAEGGMLAEFMDKLTQADYMEHDLEYHMTSMMGRGRFFQKPVNWFLPYDAEHPSLDPESVAAMDAMSDLAFQNREIISSDRYLYAMEVNWRQVEDQMRRIGMPIEGGAPAFQVKDLRRGMRDFVFGAYRFYTLFERKKSFRNIFAPKPYVPDGALTQVTHLFSEEVYERLAKRLTKQRDYTAAAYTYARMIREYGAESATGWRLIAVANIRAGQQREALSALDKAIDLEGPTMTTIKSKAKLLRECGGCRSAITLLRSYADTMTLTPAEDYELSLELLRLMGSEGLHEEAIATAYKVDYLSDELGRQSEARYLLCKTLLAAGRATEAVKMISSLGEARGLAGTILLAVGERAQGLRALQEWYDSTDNDRSKLMALLKYLERYDLSTRECGLIYDLITTHTADQP